MSIHPNSLREALTAGIFRQKMAVAMGCPERAGATTDGTKPSAFFNRKSKKIRILSIDGGGIRGIIPATILWCLEEKLQQRTGNPGARLCDYFDFLAGTSTGGILVCCYLTPDPATPDRPRLSARQALDFYLEDGREIFSRPFARKLKSLGGLLGKKYCALTLETCLKRALGDSARLSQLLRPCLVPAYDIQKQSPVFLCSQHARADAGLDFLAWEAARATTAAPTYFEPAYLRSGNRTLPLIDGGVFAPNPALYAYSEARKTHFDRLNGQPSAEDMILVSIGTGSSLPDLPYDEMRAKGAVRWTKPVFDIMLSSGAETADYHLQQLFTGSGDRRKGQYIRLSPGLCRADRAIDNVCAGNLLALHEAGLQYVAEHWRGLDEIVERLIGND